MSLLQVLLRDGVCLLSEYKGAKAMTFSSDARQPEVRAFSFRLKNETVVATQTQICIPAYAIRSEFFTILLGCIRPD